MAAACAPRWVGDTVALPASARDLMLAVDISESMLTEDLELDGQPADRLSVVKRVSGEFLRRRAGDRLGLILFGSEAYLHVPLTFDHATLAAAADGGADRLRRQADRDRRCARDRGETPARAAGGRAAC